MTSANDFLMEFMKQLVHVKNTDTRPQIVQQWTEKLEARETEIRYDEAKLHLAFAETASGLDHYIAHAKDRVKSIESQR